MNYLMLCPVCAKPCIDRHEDSCSGCGNKRNPVFVYTPLVKVVEMLIKRGIGVTGTDIKYWTSHKTKITINLAGNVPEQIFNELPDSWQLLHLSEEAYYLRCNEVHYEGMIQELEQWLWCSPIKERETLMDWCVVYYPDIYGSIECPAKVYTKFDGDQQVVLLGKAVNDPRYNAETGEFTDSHRIITTPVIAVVGPEYHTANTIYDLNLN